MALSTEESASVSYGRQCYDVIMERILSGAIKPGEEVSRRDMAQELGISVSPVTEAITQLTTEGFLETLPRRGTRVRVVSTEEVRGLLILREAIECQAARLYCGQRVRTNNARLLELATAVDTSEAGTRINEITESEFHQALVDLVECPMLSHEFQKIMRRKLFMKINLVVPWSMQPPLDNHADLLQQLTNDDPDAASMAMRVHLERGRERILR